jgi:hypothetical protein
VLGARDDIEWKLLAGGFIVENHAREQEALGEEVNAGNVK